MDTVVSADGTEIGYETRGDGAPVVLVHGGSATQDSWRGVVPHLAEEYEVVTYDRRGRGESGDGDDYDLQHEVEDLRAVVDAVDGEPAVVGHSFGGLVTLAGAADLPVDRVALYEPAVLVGDHRGDDLASRMEALVDAGDREEAVELFFGEVGASEGAPPEAVERAAPIAETVVRENYAVESFHPDDAETAVPTLLVTGERGPTHLRDAVFELDDRLADATVTELDGVGHLGITTAPDRLGGELRAFLD